ncbi:MAG: hypothetical protein AAFQ89_07580 [Cyanobacteria bacterium J06626_18]
MQTQFGFILKVIVGSTAIAIALKTWAPSLSIPATPVASLAIVLSPMAIMGAILCWQLWASDHGDAANS